MCDKIGARKGLAFILLFCVVGLVPMMFVTNAAGFIACRAIIGVGLASFVACQVWCTQQFAPSIVGTANATSGGWGNLGGGMTNLRAQAPERTHSAHAIARAYGRQGDRAVHARERLPSPTFNTL